jgi:hypothetical protein
MGGQCNKTEVVENHVFVVGAEHENYTATIYIYMTKSWLYAAHHPRSKKKKKKKESLPSCFIYPLLKVIKLVIRHSSL